MDLRLLQNDVAKMVGVKEDTIYNWENNRTSPQIHYVPRIIKFLGYVPFSRDLKTLGERIVNCRRLSGIAQKELAKSLDVDPSTLGRWERGKGHPLAKHMKKVTEFLKTASPDGQT